MDNPQDITFFLGSIDQELKNHKETMGELKEGFSGVARDLEEVKTGIKLIADRFDRQIHSCAIKFDSHELGVKSLLACHSENASKISTIEKETGINQGSKLRTRDTITYILTIIIVIASAINGFMMMKPVHFSQKDIQYLQQELQKND